MLLVLGLGNPGARYAATRHNVGFLVVDRLAERWRTCFDKRQLGAEVARASQGAHDIVLAKPQTFMNRSGQAAASLRGWYKVDVPELLVVHDELDLPYGDVRLKKGGGHGGHNGLRDLQHMLGDNNFVRVRVGIGRPPEGWDAADYVLAKWTDDEQAALNSVIDRAADAVEAVLSVGLERAMNRVNARPKAGPSSAESSTEPSAPAAPNGRERAPDHETTAPHRSPEWNS